MKIKKYIYIKLIIITTRKLKENPFHKDSMLMIYRIATSLHEHGLIDDNSMLKLRSFLDYRVDIYYSLNSNKPLQPWVPEDHPNLLSKHDYVLNTLRQKLKDAISAVVSGSEKTAILEKNNRYIDALDKKVQGYWTWRALLTAPLDDENVITDREWDRYGDLTQDQKDKLESLYGKYYNFMASTSLDRRMLIRYRKLSREDYVEIAHIN